MENRETTTGQAAQCKKTDWFKKIYGDMVDNEKLKSFIMPDGTRLEIDSTWFESFNSYNTVRIGPVSARVAAIEDEMIERILNSDDNDEATNDF